MLSLIQRQLEAVYRVSAPDVCDFVVDDGQLAEVLGSDRRPADEWVLVRESDDGVDLAVWVDGAHLAALDRAGCPTRALDDCFSALCAAIEGVSHFLMLVERARRSEPVRLLELEAQAEVDKYVCARLHRPDRAEEWRARLFRDAGFQPGLSPEERERYRTAGRLAAGLCQELDLHPHASAMLADLRDFWRAPAERRLARMRRLAA